MAIIKRYGWGARKLRELLLREGLDMKVATINRILKRNGLIHPKDSHRTHGQDARATVVPIVGIARRLPTSLHPSHRSTGGYLLTSESQKTTKKPLDSTSLTN